MLCVLYLAAAVWPCDNAGMSEAKIEAYFFTVLFAAVLCAVGYLLFPFLGAIAAAMVLATLVYPVYLWVLRRTKRPNMSAFIVVSMVVLAIVLPAIGLIFLLLEEVRLMTGAVRTVDLSSAPALFEQIRGSIVEYMPFVASFDVNTLVQEAVSGIGGLVRDVVAGTADVVFKLLVVVIALYFFLRDGRKFILQFIQLSPLADEEDVLIIRKIKAVTFSLIRGTLVVALLQGLLTGVGFVFFGLPQPVLWGSVAAIGALIPTIGTGLVAIPAFVWLVLTGQYVAALGFACWAMMIVGWVDNIIGPKLIGNNARIHPLLVLLAVLGGMWAFGIAGFLIGPLLVGLLVVLAEIYKLKIRMIHDRALIEAS